MAIAMPNDTERWRCTGCGNLTRFDVTRTVRSQDYLHLELSGRGQIEESTVLSETVEQVRCRWCGATDAVEIVARPDAARSDSAPSSGNTAGQG
ncbi:MAG TPA: hypothetical protein H9836_07160 [Candidatus Nocardiopsis merdipullorum]|nr:hypothetical protein [Candidatus Nocardiopsis merdipullorum]